MYNTHNEYYYASPPFLEADVERMARQSEQAKQAPGDVYRNRDRDWPSHNNHNNTVQSYTSMTSDDAYTRPGNQNNPGADAYNRQGMRGGPRMGMHGDGGGQPAFMAGVVCFKCTQPGHLASGCPNPAVPGNVRNPLLWSSL